MYVDAISFVVTERSSTDGATVLFDIDDNYDDDDIDDDFVLSLHLRSLLYVLRQE